MNCNSYQLHLICSAVCVRTATATATAFTQTQTAHMYEKQFIILLRLYILHSLSAHLFNTLWQVCIDVNHIDN